MIKLFEHTKILQKKGRAEDRAPLLVLTQIISETLGDFPTPKFPPPSIFGNVFLGMDILCIKIVRFKVVGKSLSLREHSAQLCKLFLAIL